MKFDGVGYWSEIKLDIVKEYAAAYSRILAAQKSPPLYHIYIDAFAGAGMHISKSSGGFIPGSPMVYYLFFASQKPVAAGIIQDIFNKYRNRGNI
ncbi:MAG: hypothetical protein HY757_08280 [Nitrospirae bacterium]|nr:hypothetical protein [Nitrospirota bacterium]